MYAMCVGLSSSMCVDVYMWCVYRCLSVCMDLCSYAEFNSSILTYNKFFGDLYIFIKKSTRLPISNTHHTRQPTSDLTHFRNDDPRPLSGVERSQTAFIFPPVTVRDHQCFFDRVLRSLWYILTCVGPVFEMFLVLCGPDVPFPPPSFNFESVAGCLCHFVSGKYLVQTWVSFGKTPSDGWGRGNVRTRAAERHKTRFTQLNFKVKSR